MHLKEEENRAERDKNKSGNRIRGDIFNWDMGGEGEFLRGVMSLVMGHGDMGER